MFIYAACLSEYQKRLPNLSSNLQPVLIPGYIQFGSLSSPSFSSPWPHQTISHSQDFMALKSPRDALSVLQKTSGNLCNLNISCSMVAINTPAPAASLNTRVSEANGLFVILSIFFDDQHIGAILSETKMIKPPCEDPSSQLT